jgi:uncharacterized DUF497 family protein
VSIAEIEAVLWSDPLVAPDLRHSAREDRFIAVGRNSEGRPLFIAFTMRMKEGRWMVRPVTARYMHKREIRRYEKTESS